MNRLFDVKLENHMIVSASSYEEAKLIALNHLTEEARFFEITEVSVIEHLDELPLSWNLECYPYVAHENCGEQRIKEFFLNATTN